MAYDINKTDGTKIVTIPDGTSDNTTSLTLFGKSFSGFGEKLNENLVKLLENSAGTGAPSSPLMGELWFDTNTKQIKVYDGSSFKPTGGSKTGNTAPSSPSVGDLWTNTDDDQVFVYTGDTRSHQANSGWELVGPVFTAGQTLSGWKIETIPSSGGNKVVSSMYVGNTRVAIVSKEDFTPSSSQSGFATIKSGLTLNSTLGAVFDGTNTQASNINITGTSNPSSTVIAGGNFLRSDVADTTTGGLTIDNDAGLTLGDSGELTMTVTSNNVTIAQNSVDKDIKFTINDGGATPHADGSFKITGSTGDIKLTGNTTVEGNLTITGEFENSSSEINIVNDAFVKVNTGNGEADAGLIVETDDTNDARIFYDVSEDYWVAGEGSSYSKILRLSDLTDDGDANKGTKPLTTDSSTGDLKVTTLTLAAVGSEITSSTSTSATTVPTLGQVATSLKRWGGSTISDDGSNSIAGNRYVETVAPTSGQGANGDIWFVRES
tara:strand:+ start:1998 stop:3470 length:1473 start_codon:yes stop_codon:yes gene_type:complete